MKKIFTTLILALAFAGNCRAAETDIDIDKSVDRSRLIPLSISGFTGEHNSALRDDLWIAGFLFVEPEKAQYIVTGKNSDHIEARLTDRISKAVLMETSYSGGTARFQAHAMSDAIVQAIMHKSGVARTKIAFKRDTGGQSEIYISDYDGHNPVAITSDHSIVAAPCWVPGKRMLLYTSYKADYPDIYSQDLGSGERKPVAKYSGLNTSAAVSPDGARVAMILSKGGSPDVYVSNIDGSNLIQLTKTTEDESSPCWSPDGRQICFVSRVKGRRTLCVIPSHGGSFSTLSTAGVLNPTEPDWSPDGKTIVFTSQMGKFSICTIPAGGGEATPLTEGEDPSWAPNSRTVIFVRRVNHKRLLSLLDVPSKRVKDTAQNSGNCSQPSWAK